MKKAQMQQMFIYIMVILVIGALILLAVQIIPKLFRQACGVEKTNFIKSLESDLNNNKNYGYKQNKVINTPCDYEEICFVNSSSTTLPSGTDSIIKSEVASGTGYDVFLKNNQGTEPILRMDNLAVKGGPVICIPTQGGKFYIDMHSIGYGKVEVAQGS